MLPALEVLRRSDVVLGEKRLTFSRKECEMLQTKFACGLTGIIGLLMILTGCISAPMNKLTESRNTTEAQVFLKPAFITQQQGKLVIYPFAHPQYAPGTGHVVTHEFYQELLRSGLYREVLLSKQLSSNPKETLISTELKDFNLAMRGKIVHLVAGSGNTTSQLAVEIQIMNVLSGTLVWFVRLDAVSETGETVDLVWSTFPGQGSQPYKALARALAQQLVKLMLPPPETQALVIPPKSPISKEPIDDQD
jgi:hypothetical protein